MFKLYKAIMGLSGPFLRRLLEKRRLEGKEDAKRMPERMGHASRFRAKGKLVWLHAASVGEAQSALILIEELLRRNPALHILVTSGTVSSAALLKNRLPDHAVHQFYPLDHPEWTRSFIEHWCPDLILWMESEIWPSMLHEIKTHKIPAALINAHLSPRSFRRWRLGRPFIAELLSTFSLVLAQTQEDGDRLSRLGARNIHVTDNLKYSAQPLPCDPIMLENLQNRLGHRPVWLFASTHADEESLACRIHLKLQDQFPNLLTVIVPRHPERRGDILQAIGELGLKVRLRSISPEPVADDQIYIADTMGELGLFYRVCPVACIGRSFSSDGGGGHNPIEAATLGCAVLHGPDVQNLARIYDDMDRARAAQSVRTEDELCDALRHLLANPGELNEFQRQALRFAADKEKVIDIVLAQLDPLLTPLDKPGGVRACA